VENGRHTRSREANPARGGLVVIGHRMCLLHYGLNRSEMQMTTLNNWVETVKVKEYITQKRDKRKG